MLSGGESKKGTSKQSNNVPHKTSFTRSKVQLKRIVRSKNNKAINTPFFIKDWAGVIGHHSPIQPQSTFSFRIKITYNKYELKTNIIVMAKGMPMRFSRKWNKNKIPTKNSMPIISRATHSDKVQFKKVVSVILQPNCSRVGILK